MNAPDKHRSLLDEDGPYGAGPAPTKQPSLWAAPIKLSRLSWTLLAVAALLVAAFMHFAGRA